MAVQDRNVHKDAALIRKLITSGAIATIVAADKDEIQFVFKPRFNFRLTDAFFSCKAIAVANAELRACIVKELSAIGAPQCAQAAAVTFAIEALEQLDAGVYTAVGATAAQAFGHVAQIAASSWGVFTIQIDGAQAITTKPGSLSMAYLTEEDAIKNAPAPDALNGLVCVLTMEIGAGGPFICATTDTNDAMVDSFNTIDRGGHPIAAPTLATQSDLQATRATRLKVAGVGNLIGEANDSIAITARSTGNATFSDGFATAEFRKTPAQGEGVEAGTGLSKPFVP